MDLGVTIALGAAGVGLVTTAGFAIAALVFRSRLATAERDLGAVMATAKTAEIERDAAFDHVARLTKELKDERLQKAKLYERLAALGAPGAAELVDDHIRSLYPDADDHTAGAGGDRDVPDRGTGAAADADADDLSGDRRPREPRDRDLL